LVGLVTLGTTLRPEALMLSTGQAATLACLLEVTARKPGNVHRFRDFDDLTYTDFLLSAAAIGPALDRAPGRRLGATVLEAIQATRQVVRTNTNLGIVLLLAPLAAVSPGQEFRTGVAAVLDRLDLDDSRLVYRAIRLANPGGLGHVAEQDVAGEPTHPLRQIMALAADRDLVARQYADGFHAVLVEGVPALCRGLEHTGDLERAIILCQLQLLAGHPDSLIARKCGPTVAEEASRRASALLEQGWPRCGDAPLEAFDTWLTADGHRRNPGTTADLVTACLFAAFREGQIGWPVPFAGPLRGVAPPFRA
jgi:triphosphoribosyl-dephospho-CoA synthase